MAVREMSEFSPQHEYDTTEAEWQLAFQESLRFVGNALGSDGDMIARFTHLRLVEGEEEFKPVPEMKMIDGEVEVTCNLEAYEQWVQVLYEVDGMTDEEIRSLYLATASSWVELSFLAVSANKEEKFAMNPAQKSRSRKRALMIVNKLQTQEDLLVSAEKLEEEGVFGATDAILGGGLTPRQILEVNKLRYGLGMSFYALKLDTKKQEQIKQAFKISLIHQLQSHEETLLTFLDAFSRADEYADIVEDHYKKIKRYAFPEFLFAGTIPMGYL